MMFVFYRDQKRENAKREKATTTSPASVCRYQSRVSLPETGDSENDCDIGPPVWIQSSGFFFFFFVSISFRKTTKGIVLMRMRKDLLTASDSHGAWRIGE